MKDRKTNKKNKNILKYKKRKNNTRSNIQMMKQTRKKVRKQHKRKDTIKGNTRKNTSNTYKNTNHGRKTRNNTTNNTYNNSKRKILRQRYIQALRHVKKTQYGGAFPTDLINSATKTLQSKIQDSETNTFSINPDSGYFSTLTESSLEFIKKLNLYFLVMVLSFGNDLFKQIIPNPEKFQNASIEEIKEQVFKSSTFFTVLMRTLSNKEFVEKWQSMFKEFYDKLVSPIVEGGVETLEGQIEVYEQVLKNMMYRFSKSVVLGLWDGISGALDIIPGAGTVIGIIEIVQMILQSVMSIIHSIQGPVKFIVDMSDLLGEVGAPLRDTILEIEDIYNSFREIYDSVTAPITKLQQGIQGFNAQPKLPSETEDETPSKPSPKPSPKLSP